MSLTTYHRVLSTGHKQRAWCVASVHGNENQGTLVPAAPQTWSDYFGRTWGGIETPHFIVKIDDRDTAANMVDHIKSANAAGFLTILQLRDDETEMRSKSAAIAEARASLAILNEAGARPWGFQYGNEPDFNNTGIVGDEQRYADRQFQVYNALGGGEYLYFAGALSSWANAVNNAALFRKSWEENGRPRIYGFSVHQHRGHPDLAFDAGSLDVLERLTPGLQVANHETGLLPPLDLSDNVAAAYDVLNNLTHAHYGIPCCDYTLINGSGVPGVGNGLFLRDGTPNPSGRALRDLAAPFVASPMARAMTLGLVGPRVFANQAGQVVLASAAETAEQNVTKYFNQAVLGRTEALADWGVTAPQVFAWLDGTGNQPSNPPSELAGILDMAGRVYTDSTNAFSGRQETRIRLPYDVSSAAVLGEEFYETAASDVWVEDGAIVVTHDSNTALRLEVS